MTLPPPVPVKTTCRPFVHPFATLRTSFQRPTQPFSGAPSSSPSLAPLSCPYQTPRSVADACPSYVRISQTISSVCARTIASMLSKTVLPARRRTIGVWSSRLGFRHPRRRRSMEWCARRSMSRSDLFGLHVMQPLCTTGSFRSPRLSATATSIVSSHPGDHTSPSCTAGGTPRPCEDAAFLAIVVVVLTLPRMIISVITG